MVQTVLWPLGTMDLAPYFARLRPEVGAIFPFEPGNLHQEVPLPVLRVGAEQESETLRPLGFHRGLFYAADDAVNTGRLDPVQAAETVKEYMTLAIDADDEAAGMRMIPDLVLGQRVLTEIVCVKKERLASLTACAEQGVVTLGGLSNTKAAIDKAVAAARAVPGVRDVKNDMHLVQEYEV